MEDEVILELRDSDCDEGGAAIHVAAMERGDWIPLLLARKCKVFLRASRVMLSERSSYFRSLFSNFREAHSDHVVVTWNLEVLANILQGILFERLDVAPCSVADLLEGATFFGCDSIISECQVWIASDMLSCSRDNQDVLQYVPRLWKVATETGVPTIASACARYLAINFEDAGSGEFLENIPLLLFQAAVNHPFLTISSERNLFQAILRRCSFETRDCALELISKVRMHWVPVDFLAAQSDNSLLNSHNRDLPLEPPEIKSAGLRLSQYTKILDLTGCQQVTDVILFDSVLCSPINVEGEYILHSFLNSSSRYSNSSASGPFLNHLVSLYPLQEERTQFELMQLPSVSEEVNKPDRSGIPLLNSLRVLLLGKCWRVRPEELFLWIKTTCSSLQQLNLSQCPQFSAFFLSHLASACPFIEVADFSRDLSVIHLATVKKPCTGKLLTTSYKKGSWDTHRYLVELHLTGHTELKDSELSLISKKCPSISAISLSGCSNLSDSGIAKFLQSHPKLRLLRAAITAFGFQSVCALLAASDQECNLEVLDLAYCTGLSAGALVRLLTRISSFLSLSLCYTNLIDDGLFLSCGTSLETLNIRGTQVTGAAISYTIRKNFKLTSLNFRDCRGAFSYEGLKEEKLDLRRLKAGWGVAHILANAKLPFLQTLHLGLGAQITSTFLRELPSRCPQLQHLSLSLQDLLDDELNHAIAKLPFLTTLKLRHTLQPLSGKFLESLTSNLVSLKLEDVCPSLTNAQLASVATSCKGLRQLSLTACRWLDSGALSIICKAWPALSELKLEDCGEATREGAAVLLCLYGLQSLTLRHNGAGLPRNFIMDASYQFPLLRCLSLDSCDTSGHFNTPQDGNWRSISTIKIAYCRHVPSAFCFEGRGRRVHRHTEVMERGGTTLRTFIVKERL
ncbi:BTB/POZ domain-containing protein FBL11 [Selaginella moellendorffii]|uniref:BTB/POZ domain-containing protein FBL11 n=1 Tax=Selaginella moellendorffii TaxID=88036 RepID=UPI000D1C9E10|nr:BTB/POZ domain-containing protein FBL11 [Selaginella moellendorffii]XP_024520959.1 BTB/POZ domain-containing protein FBL11 [Selaginella moellendorffii]|eukprot:XP_024520958.1 BTB/POZ domain-containing protein FBL11 [Selaginella moellendorffii]